MTKQRPPKRGQSVLVVIATRTGECLLMRRVRPVGFWQSVTGSLEPGESSRLAAVREVWEETGLRAGGALLDLGHSVLFPIPLPWRARYRRDVCFNREYWFALIVGARCRIRLNRREHLDYCWLPLRRAAALTGSWTNRQAIQRLAMLPRSTRLAMA